MKLVIAAVPRKPARLATKIGLRGRWTLAAWIGNIRR
jgi:hypothetical protein